MLSMVGIPSMTTSFGMGVLVILANCRRSRSVSPYDRFRRIFRVFHSIHYTIFLLKTQLYKERPHKIPDVFLAKKE